MNSMFPFAHCTWDSNGGGGGGHDARHQELDGIRVSDDPSLLLYNLCVNVNMHVY